MGEITTGKVDLISEVGGNTTERIFALLDHGGLISGGDHSWEGYFYWSDSGYISGGEVSLTLSHLYSPNLIPRMTC